MNYLKKYQVLVRVYNVRSLFRIKEQVVIQVCLDLVDTQVSRDSVGTQVLGLPDIAVPADILVSLVTAEIRVTLVSRDLAGIQVLGLQDIAENQATQV